MTIKMTSGNPCKCACVSLDREELESAGTTADALTLGSRSTRMLLRKIFALLESFCELRRDRHFVTVRCRPLRSGGCRFFVEFTRVPSGRLCVFGCADDLLDAVNHLARRGRRPDISGSRIGRAGDCFTLYIPAGECLSPAELAILREYSVSGGVLQDGQ